MSNEDEVRGEEPKAIQAVEGVLRDLRQDPLIALTESVADVEIDSDEEVIFPAKSNTPIVQGGVIFDENAPYPSMGEGFSVT